MQVTPRASLEFYPSLVGTWQSISLEASGQISQSGPPLESN